MLVRHSIITTALDDSLWQESHAETIVSRMPIFRRIWRSAHI